MNSYKIKYSYTSAGTGNLIESFGCYTSKENPIESTLITWCKANTIGGGYDYKIINVSDPY